MDTVLATRRLLTLAFLVLVAPALMAQNLSVDSPPVGEADGSVTFTITLDSPAIGPVDFTVDTADVDATAGSDYTAWVAYPVSITGGNDTAFVSVTILDDAVYELVETFTLTVSNLTGASIAVGTGTATITDDDVDPCRI